MTAVAVAGPEINHLGGTGEAERVPEYLRCGVLVHLGVVISEAGLVPGPKQHLPGENQKIGDSGAGKPFPGQNKPIVPMQYTSAHPRVVVDVWWRAWLCLRL